MICVGMFETRELAEERVREKHAETVANDNEGTTREDEEATSIGTPYFIVKNTLTE